MQRGRAEPPTGASQASSYATPRQPASTAGSFHSGVTGAVPLNAPATAGNFGATPTGQPEFPAITTDLATKYGGMFQAASKTATGAVGGAEVLRLLAAVPASTAVKRQAWDLVAGAPSAHFAFTTSQRGERHRLRDQPTSAACGHRRSGNSRR